MSAAIPSRSTLCFGQTVDRRCPGFAAIIRAPDAQPSSVRIVSPFSGITQTLHPAGPDPGAAATGTRTATANHPDIGPIAPTVVGAVDPFVLLHVERLGVGRIEHDLVHAAVDAGMLNLAAEKSAATNSAIDEVPSLAGVQVSPSSSERKNPATEIPA